MGCINYADLANQGMGKNLGKCRDIKKPNLYKMKKKIAVTTDNAVIGMLVINQHNDKGVGLIRNLNRRQKALVVYQDGQEWESIGLEGQFNLLIYNEEDNGENEIIKVQRRNLKVKRTVSRRGSVISCRAGRVKCKGSD